MKPDPQAERLSRFTPDASALSRDELMFAAGRASVRPGRFWKCAAGLLLLTQAVTLALLLTDRGPTPVPETPVAVESEPTPPVEASPTESDSLIAQRRRLRDDPETGYRPIVSAVRMTESKVIFTAGSRLNFD